MSVSAAEPDTATARPSAARVMHSIVKRVLGGDELAEAMVLVNEMYDAEAADAPAPADSASSTEAAPAVPARGASKEKWLAYADAVEEDPDARAKLDGMTRDELAERYGA